MQFFTKPFDGDGGFQNHVRTTEIHGPLFLGDVTRHVQQQFAFVFTFRVVFGNGGLWGGLELPSGGQLINEFFAGEKWWECMDEDLARGNGDHVGGEGVWVCGRVGVWGGRVRGRRMNVFFRSGLIKFIK